jgi:hypothetical protein
MAYPQSNRNAAAARLAIMSIPSNFRTSFALAARRMAEKNLKACLRSNFFDGILPGHLEADTHAPALLRNCYSPNRYSCRFEPLRAGKF